MRGSEPSRTRPETMMRVCSPCWSVSTSGTAGPVMPAVTTRPVTVK